MTPSLSRLHYPCCTPYHAVGFLFCLTHSDFMVLQDTSSRPTVMFVLPGYLALSLKNVIRSKDLVFSMLSMLNDFFCHSLYLHVYY